MHARVVLGTDAHDKKGHCGLDTDVWVCVMLGVECFVRRRMLNYHTGTRVDSDREQVFGGHHAQGSFRW